jgi:cytochrome c553
MSTDRLFSLRNPWFTTSVAALVFLMALSAFAGFIWLPSLQPNARFGGIWDAICRAAGVPIAASATEPVPAAFKLSDVVVTQQRLSPPSALSIGRGATLAMQCAICHGSRGLSNADTPNLAGQYAITIFKELQDFKSGARVNAIMTPQVAGLSDQDMLDLAAYYSYLPRLPGYHPTATVEPAIVVTGAPMRNIAPCASCHGGLDNKAGSPWLEGESATYLRAQLTDFGSGTRHNDISEQMRNIARHMTPAEIEAAAQYYAAQP